jgi:K+-sensing histidine kinase KdpD
MAVSLRQAVLPIGLVAAATALTWVLWPYVQPSSTPLFFVAVMASSLYGGIIAGLATTMLSTAVIALLFMPPVFSVAMGSDDAFRLVVFGGVALLTYSRAAERSRAEAQQRKLIDELRDANARITTLSEVLPVCPHCKRVRSSETKWQTLESYLDEAPDLRMSHALCPQCARQVYPEFHTH